MIWSRLVRGVPEVTKMGPRMVGQSTANYATQIIWSGRVGEAPVVTLLI